MHLSWAIIPGAHTCVWYYTHTLFLFNSLFFKVSNSNLSIQSLFSIYSHKTVKVKAMGNIVYHQLYPQFAIVNLSGFVKVNNFNFLNHCLLYVAVVGCGKQIQTNHGDRIQRANKQVMLQNTLPLYFYLYLLNRLVSISYLQWQFNLSSSHLLGVCIS